MGNNRWLSYRLFCLLNELPVIESSYKVKGKTASVAGYLYAAADAWKSPSIDPGTPVMPCSNPATGGPKTVDPCRVDEVAYGKMRKRRMP